MLRKTIFIIGGSSDIGQATAKLFIEKGYNVALTYNSTLPNILNYAKEYNVECELYKLDVNNKEEIVKTFNNVFKRFDYIESVICCAGISYQEKMLIDYDEKEITNIINTNLLSVILCNKEAVNHFLNKKHGNIVNISSIYGIYGGSCEAVYSATKAGIIGLTQSLALEVSDMNIRVNAVSPGFITTKMTRHFNENEKQAIIQSTPLKRLGTPLDVANAIFFLSSENSSFITGENIIISGGALRFN